MHEQSNDIPEHRHPELEQLIAERYRLLHQIMVTGFDDLTRELRDGFGRVNTRLDAIEGRLGTIEAQLRRINPNGQATP